MKKRKLNLSLRKTRKRTEAGSLVADTLGKGEVTGTASNSVPLAPEKSVDSCVEYYDSMTERIVKCSSVDESSRNSVDVACPICGCVCTLDNINTHLDQGCSNNGVVVPDAKNAIAASDMEVYESSQFQSGDINDALRAILSSGGRPITKIPLEADCIKHGDCGEEMRDNYEIIRALQTSGNFSEEPYYVRNFVLVYTFVHSCTNLYERYFSKEERELLARVVNSPVEARRLFLRIFARKRNSFFRLSQLLHYKEISSTREEPVDKCILRMLKELCVNELLEPLTLEADKSKEKEVLDIAMGMLSTAEVKVICQGFKLSSKGKKEQDICNILQFCFSQQAVSFCERSPLKKLYRDLKKAIGFAVRVPETVYTLCDRLNLVFFSSSKQDDDALTSLLLMDMNRVCYPHYQYACFSDVKSGSLKFFPEPLYGTKQEMIQFQEALVLEAKAEAFMEMNKFEHCLELFSRVKPYVESNEYSSSECECKQYCSKTVLLSRFRPMWIYCRLASKAVEAYEKLRRYNEACGLLKVLLNQKSCSPKRGLWWSRLVTNCEHLRCYESALRACVDGLYDPFVRSGHRLNLRKKLNRFLNVKKKSVRAIFCDIIHPEVLKLSKISQTICPAEKEYMIGSVVPGAPSGKLIYMHSEAYSQGLNNVCLISVEELVLKKLNAQEQLIGFHCENATPRVLFALGFWDILFSKDERSNYSFTSPFQMAPLELCTDIFFALREKGITKRIEFIKSMRFDELYAFYELALKGLDGGYLNFVVSEKDLETDSLNGNKEFLQSMPSMAACMGSNVVAGICLAMAEDYKHMCSGFPDLTLFNIKEEKACFVEVKSKNDTLSTQQEVWIDVLSSCGADVRICKVSHTEN
eukprot:Nk52_evm3s2426 gene=Nk52_evmTU3s2426